MHLLHGLKDNRIISHTKIVIGTPDLDFIMWAGSVGDWEFSSEPVYIIEVAVGFILVLLVQLGDIKPFIVKGIDGLGGFSGGLDFSSSLLILVEGTASSSSSSSLFLGMLGGGGLNLQFASCSEVFCHSGSCTSSGGMRTHLDCSSGGRENALFLVDLLDVSVACDAGIARNKLLRANIKSGTHNRATSCSLGQDRDRRETRR